EKGNDRCICNVSLRRQFRRASRAEARGDGARELRGNAWTTIQGLHRQRRKARGHELLRLGLRGRGESLLYRCASGARHRSLRHSAQHRVRADCHAGGERSRMTPSGRRRQVMDADLSRMSREQLIAEVKKLRRGIREHRDSTLHELCWHHPELWGLLPEKTDPVPVVPEWPQFMEGCVKYRQSLDEQAASAPRSRKRFER